MTEAPDDQPPLWKLLAVVAVAATVLVIGINAISSSIFDGFDGDGANQAEAPAPPRSPSPPPPPPPPPVELTVAEKLAQLDENRAVDANSTVVRRFQERLDQMTMKCSAQEIEISDLTVRARELLAEDGVDRKLYDVITGVNRGTPAGGDIERCREIFARYVTVQRALG